MKVYWWNKRQNFGDELNVTLLKCLDVESEWSPAAEAELVVVGSILEHLPPGWSGTVCGAGKMKEDSAVDLTNARVLALRGRLTAAGVTGLKTTPVFGDPALLVPMWVRQWHAKYDLGIVPHWTDSNLHQRYPYGHFIDPTAPPGDVVTEIAKCKRIISSSLHGIIVADAYGIPRQAELFPNAGREGGDFKFRDYATIYNTHPHFGEMWRAPHEVVERVQGELRDALADVTARPRLAPVPRPTPVVIRKHEHPQISLLVPFRDDGEHRSRVWEWLRRFWEGHLESVEIIQGHDGLFPFSKAAAVNDAAERASGRVFVILDADAYMDARGLQACADRIESAVQAGQRLWLMPYNKLYRLNQESTLDLLGENPTAPYSVSSPPPEEWLQPKRHSPDLGHIYGAMMQMMPREAFFMAGGMDCRMRGWGSEDGAFMKAVDTLYCQHEVAPNDLLHMWHARPGDDWKTRRWIGQQWTPANLRLAQRYSQASGERGFMRELVGERRQPRPFPA